MPATSEGVVAYIWRVFASLQGTAKDLKMEGGKGNELASSKFPLSIFKARGKQRVN